MKLTSLFPFRLFGRGSTPVANARPPVPQVRRYNSARPTRLTAGAGGFGNGVTPMEANRQDLLGLILHSRYLAHNNDYWRSFLLLCRRHIAGPSGIRLKPVARNERGELDTGDNTAHAAAWEEWGKRGNCTVCGRFTLTDIQHMLTMMVPRDGGVFIRHFRGTGYGPFGYQIQLITQDRLALDFNATLANGGYISGGVECDALDRVIAWHFYRTPPGAAFTRRGERVRIPASDVTYVAIHEDYAAHLCMPWGHTAANRINMTGGFEEAALTAARAGASKMGFFERENADDDPSASGEPEIEEFEPGMMETLPPGVTFKAFDPGYPDAESSTFVKLMLRGAASGFGVSYNGLTNDLESTNFASLHIGKAEERDEWRILQGWFSAHALQPIHEEWLPLAILSGQFAVPMTKLAKFQAVRWKARGWGAVNPVDEANSNVANVAAGFTSPQRVIESKGGDADEVLAELAEFKAKAEALGLSFNPQLVPVNATGAADAAAASATPAGSGRPGKA